MTIPQLLSGGLQFPGVIGIENLNLVPSRNEVLEPCNGLLRAFAGRWIHVPELRTSLITRAHQSPLTPGSMLALRIT